jgi:hypothetical protein
MITSSTGNASFYGGQYDLVVHGTTLSWAAISGGNTEIRSVPISGGSVTYSTVAGGYALSVWPYAVSTGGGNGDPITVMNLTTKAKTTVKTATGETVTCSPAWCRITVVDATGAVMHIDAEKPDGTGRVRLAGADATPAAVDAALLDRYVPLAIDNGDTTALSVYDLTSAKSAIVAPDVAGAQARGTLLWWSVGDGANLTWRALDLQTLT